jgi:positive regulator of sigma E activity
LSTTDVADVVEPPGMLLWRCGRVANANATECVVVFEARRCAGCDGRCARMLLAPTPRVREMTARVTGAPPAAGDEVVVGISVAGMRIASAIVFGLPLFGLVCGGWLASLTGAAPVGAMIGFCEGTALAVLLGRRADALLRPILL